MKDYLAKDLFDDVKVFDIKDLPSEKRYNKYGDLLINGTELPDDLLDLMYSTFNTTFETPRRGQLIKARVIGLGESQALIELNGKTTTSINLEKEPDEYRKNLKIGQMVDAVVMKDYDESVKAKSEIVLSLEKAAGVILYNEILEEAKNKTGKVRRATVKEMIDNGGYIVSIQGIDCFMPGSHAGMNKLFDFASLIGTEMNVIPINFVPTRNMIVVSHKEYLNAALPEKVKNAGEDLDIEYTGFVTGTTKFGIFCQFEECLTGMIHKSELTGDLKDRHKRNEIKPGEEISFYIKEIVNDKKIILSLDKYIDPWYNIEEVYPVQSTVEVKVTAVKNYGAFIKFSNNIFGLLPSKEVKENSIDEGSTINVKITKIDKAAKKIFAVYAKDES